MSSRSSQSTIASTRVGSNSLRTKRRLSRSICHTGSEENRPPSALTSALMLIFPPSSCIATATVPSPTGYGGNGVAHSSVRLSTFPVLVRSSLSTACAAAIPEVAKWKAFIPSRKFPAALRAVRVDRSNSSTAAASSTTTSSVSTSAMPRSARSLRSGRPLIRRHQQRPVEELGVRVARLQAQQLHPHALRSAIQRVQVRHHLGQGDRLELHFGGDLPVRRQGLRRLGTNRRETVAHLLRRGGFFQKRQQRKTARTRDPLIQARHLVGDGLVVGPQTRDSGQILLALDDFPIEPRASFDQRVHREGVGRQPDDGYRADAEHHALTLGALPPPGGQRRLHTPSVSVMVMMNRTLDWSAVVLASLTATA